MGHCRTNTLGPFLKKEEKVSRKALKWKASSRPPRSLSRLLTLFVCLLGFSLVRSSVFNLLQVKQNGTFTGPACVSPFISVSPRPVLNANAGAFRARAEPGGVQGAHSAARPSTRAFFSFFFLTERCEEEQEAALDVCRWVGRSRLGLHVTAHGSDTAR